MEEKRIAVAAIVIDELAAAEEVNKVLHEYSDIIIGRMGIPYKERGISLIQQGRGAEILLHTLYSRGFTGQYNNRNYSRYCLC